MAPRARFVTGAKATTRYTNEYKKRVFPADRPGRCHICTQEYAQGDPMRWAPKIKYQTKNFRPVHELCADWKPKAPVQNKPTSDGGYDVAPATLTRDDYREIAARNRAIDKKSVFNSN